jgi:hypothetical protein
LPRKKLVIAIPTSIVSDTPHLREKTFKIGLIGRAAAVFRVNEIIVFKDKPRQKQEKELRLISTILAYMETPQYLRKKLFKLTPELRYAGILPPLRTPHHPLTDKSSDLRIGEIREAIVVSTMKKGVFVDVGVEKPAFIPEVRLSIGRRVTVKIVQRNGILKASLTKPEEVDEYWGYGVKAYRLGLGQILRKRKFELTVATSRYGKPLQEILKQLRMKWLKARSMLVIFGSPREGLYEIAEQEGLNLDDIVDFVVNTIPKQGTKTVRTEEAIFASLSLFNFLLRTQRLNEAFRYK